MTVQFPKQIFWVVGNKNRLYHSRGHVKLSLNHNPDDRVFTLDFHVGGWVEITEQFR